MNHKKEEFQNGDRREFFRVDFRRPVKFRQVQDSEDHLKIATIENISQSGILFKTRILPQLSSVLWMDMDFRTLNICREIEDNVLIYESGILGRVVRIEVYDEENKADDVGVCFLRKTDPEEAQGLGDGII